MFKLQFQIIRYFMCSNVKYKFKLQYSNYKIFQIIRYFMCSNYNVFKLQYKDFKVTYIIRFKVFKVLNYKWVGVWVGCLLFRLRLYGQFRLR